MIFGHRLRAATRLARARGAFADQTLVDRLAVEDEARVARLGDVEGQTNRAHAHAARIESSLRVNVYDSSTSTPTGWPGK